MALPTRKPKVQYVCDGCPDAGDLCSPSNNKCPDGCACKKANTGQVALDRGTAEMMDDNYYNLSLMRPTTAEQAKGNCITSAQWNDGRFGANQSMTQAEKDAQDALYEEQCKGPWVEDKDGNWKQIEEVPVVTPPNPTINVIDTTETQTAGLGDKNMIMWLFIGGFVLYAYNTGLLTK